jgi:hypothetical protein
MFTLLFIVPIFVAFSLWTKKGGTPAVGIVLGVFLGWVGVIVAYFATPTNPKPGPRDRPLD